MILEEKNILKMQLLNMKASLWNRVCQSIDCVQLLIIKSEYHEKSYLYIDLSDEIMWMYCKKEHSYAR